MVMKKMALGLGMALLLVVVGFGAAHAQLYSNTNTNTSGTTGTTNMSSTVNGSGTVNGTSSTVPGVPNTGAGGDAGMNIALLGSSAAIMAAGALYIVRKAKSVKIERR